MSEKLKVSSDKLYYYSDSKVVLGYLNNSERQFSRYVSRRVELILNMCQNRPWFYVSSKENPADLASRGQGPEFLDNPIWFNGPKFLSDIKFELSSINFEGNLPEEKIPDVCTMKTIQTDHVLSLASIRCNNLDKFLKICAKIFCFRNFLDKARQRLGISVAPRRPLGFIERSDCLLEVLKVYQLCIDIDLSRMSPFVDTHGILRVGGRLKNSKIPLDVKYPIIVPRNCPLAILIIRYYHCNSKHQGRTISLAAVRYAGYFIPGCRSLVDKVIRECFMCRRLRGQPCIPKMADLPRDRLEESPPFTSTGVDVMGPFNITEGITTRRNASTKKVWGLVMICLVTRAVHIETLPSLDTSSFKNALRRFFSIRGVCKLLRSDNGSNFVAAFRQMDSENGLKKLADEAERHGIKWIFNPPKASHFGGSWERSIGSIRKVMATTLYQLRNRPITRDEITTLFHECASIINNTPLYQISPHPNDPLPITPAVLLTLKSSPNPPPGDDFNTSDINSYGIRRWRKVQQLSEEFWKSWRKHYILELNSRVKWTKDKRNLLPGDVVLACDKQLPRNDWQTGVIEKTLPSSDGVVRACEVRFNHGTLRRAACDLVLLVPRSPECFGSSQNL